MDPIKNVPTVAKKSEATYQIVKYEMSVSQNIQQRQEFINQNAALIKKAIFDYMYFNRTEKSISTINEMKELAYIRVQLDHVGFDLAGKDADFKFLIKFLNKINYGGYLKFREQAQKAGWAPDYFNGRAWGPIEHWYNEVLIAKSGSVNIVNKKY
jgi:hypothetical protein